MKNGHIQHTQAATTSTTSAPTSTPTSAEPARAGSETRGQPGTVARQRRDVHTPASETQAVNADDGGAALPVVAQPAQLDPEDPLIWRVMISALYHQKRERFLDGVDRCSQAIGMLGGAAAFAAVFTTPGGFSVPGAIVAVVGAGALCYGPGAKARRHAELARDYKSLHAAIVRCGAPLTVEQRCDFDARILLLEANEPAALGALVTQCHNELSVALDRAHAVTPLRLRERLFANWIDFDQTPAEKPKELP